MTTLYELTNEFAQLLDALENAQNDTEAAFLLDELDALSADIEQKAANYARALRNYEAQIVAVKTERERLTEQQKRAEKQIERLKARLLEAMQAMNLKDISTPIGKWRVQMNPPGCSVLDERAVPEAFRVPQPDKIDRAAILRHFKETGELLPGVEITQNMSIRFK